jgi:hypothetical protein
MSEELQGAEAHLRHAEAELEMARTAEKAAVHDLNVAEAAEEAAIRDTEKALEEIHAAEHEHSEIHFKVDGEPYETKARELTPNVIIKDFAGRDPVTHYLVQIEGTHKESYRDKGNEPIKMHDGMKFQTVFIGPTPVSDDTGSPGFVSFMTGLTALGYKPTPVPNLKDHLYFDYTIETGVFAGRTVQLGLNVPADFPMTTPSGPYVSPHVLPINISAGAVHPAGAIHHEQAKPFEKELGGLWEYWSRPFSPDWVSQKKTVAVYMSHIWRLWDSQ